ncbi:hypothetical protein ALT721_2570029 [Alteromonas alvinellae]
MNKVKSFLSIKNALSVDKAIRKLRFTYHPVFSIPTKAETVIM